MGESPVLEIRGLHVTFTARGREIHAVRGVDLTIERGQTLALLGESGSGKSVTAKAVMGLLDQPGVEVRSASARLGGRDLLAMSAEERRALRGSAMTLVFQDALSALNPVLSIGDQIGELFRVHQGSSRKEARSRSVELLDLVGIPAAATRIGDYPHQFSGGMRQRILVAMAVALEPDLIIADEPTTALDVTVQAQILELIDRLRRELGTAVLLITHDLGVAAEVSDQVAVMYAGRIVESGRAEELYDRPAHPYTAALLAAVPDLDRPASELRAIPGAPPSPALTPPGCSFAPRCERASDVCTGNRPVLAPLGTGAGRYAACHHVKEMLDGAPA
ncbi:ABC transporter ATP-binding protein [Nonomuraea sp. KC401]|uniref:ABC transporter ATP-binding protein n=1 Tax=unclassified Nonomuraea TaxID=2593643 RepID=UPI0010FD765D|nr:ABC transporter ATP-binding protein [Nonomuraea sp. KC401]NBE94869.1 ATP-binding cassette domain-containing protein [Nonomuraea sp. K271]TLF72273.1 ABC transporter ATP-binding protein [Nonomuraea sp. KC401]